VRARLESQFREDVGRALEYASELGAPLLHLMAGVRPADVDEARSMATFVRNVGWAADQARAVGVRLMLEAINKRDVPDLVLRRWRRRGGRRDCRPRRRWVLFDVYHAQVDRGDLADRLTLFSPPSATSGGRQSRSPRARYREIGYRSVRTHRRFRVLGMDRL